jgi:hypothetical protein
MQGAVRGLPGPQLRHNTDCHELPRVPLFEVCNFCNTKRCSAVFVVPVLICEILTRTMAMFTAAQIARERS